MTLNEAIELIETRFRERMGDPIVFVVHDRSKEGASAFQFHRIVGVTTTAEDVLLQIDADPCALSIEGHLGTGALLERLRRLSGESGAMAFEANLGASEFEDERGRTTIEVHCPITTTGVSQSPSMCMLIHESN